MPEILLIVELLLTAAALALLAVLVARKGRAELDSRPLLEALDRSAERTERAVREEIARGRDEAAASGRAAREEAAAAMKAFGDTVLRRLTESSLLQKNELTAFAARLDRLVASNETKLEAMRSAVEAKLAQIQADNAARLEEMRKTVDEKLQGTLERRLGESFRLVSDRLEMVHKGLGEMQTLAAGVGDLKKVLSNVKTRGTWGEVQLGTLLEQVLTPEQYEANVAPRPGSGERVEFVIRLPGRDEADGQVVYLPIDAKFPQEDYHRLLAAQEAGDAAAAEAAATAMEQRVRACGKDICEKYLHPPQTTDFAIMFLPTEGLYAEVLRRPGLAERLQRHCRVVLAGPTTLAALLNSLQMGFRTLAIQKRSSEVWKVLSAVKTEFGKFGEALASVKTKLDQASGAIGRAEVRTRAIERTLRDVEALPAAEVPRLPDLAEPSPEDAPPEA